MLAPQEFLLMATERTLWEHCLSACALEQVRRQNSCTAGSREQMLKKHLPGDSWRKPEGPVLGR